MSDFTTPSRRAVIGGAIGFASLSALPAFAQETPLEEKGYALGDVILGDPSAPVTIIEYASFTCPHCASFHRNAYPQIKADYIETGKAKLVMREVYFDQFGVWSSMVSRCGGEDSYYNLVDMFLGRQQDWYLSHVEAFRATNNPQPVINEIMKIGRLAGLSNERMNACLSDQSLLERVVTDYQTNAGEDGVRSTPTFFINGQKVEGAVTGGEMARIIETFLPES